MSDVLTAMHRPSTPNDETTPRDKRAASSATVDLALPGHQVRPLEGEAPQALRGCFTLQSALHAFDLPSRVQTPGAQHRVRLAELGHLGYLVLRGKSHDAAFMEGVASVLGQAPPTQPRAVVPCASGVLLWISPDEWLLLCPRSRRDALLERLAVALAAVSAQVVDNSGGFTLLRLSGVDQLRLLRHLSPYDFDQLALGSCASTVISKATLGIVRTDADGVFLLFRRSFADYIWRLIERSARPYQLCITTPQQCPDTWIAPLFELV